MIAPDLQTLRYAVTVAEHLSFRRAAEALKIHQPAVSRRIRRLEETIGVSLFERHSGGLQLTSSGRHFIRDIRNVLWMLDRAVDQADRESRVDAGGLVLGFLPTLVSGHLHETLKAFRLSSPNVTMEFMEGSSANQLEWLRSRRIDVGLLSGRYEASDLKHMPLWEERLFVALPKGHRLTAITVLQWEDLRREQLLIRAFESGSVDYGQFAARIFAKGQRPSVSQHLTARDNLLGLVGAGFGITLVPESEIGVASPDIVFRPIADSDALLSISTAWRPANDNPALRRFVSLLRQARTKSQV